MSERAAFTSRGDGIGIMGSIQAKLLTMLAVLSLPLLVVSLLQLERYARNMNEQAGVIVRAEARAAALALEDWLEDNVALANTDAPLPISARENLYTHLSAQLPPEARVIVRDARGQIVPLPVAAPLDAMTDNSATNNSAAVNVNAADTVAANGEAQAWTDGEDRITSSVTLPAYGWSVAVGSPLLERSIGGRSTMLLAAVWALALSASILIAVWAVGRFTNPLRRLTNAATVFGEGKMDERAIVETRDEVGTLAGTFNQMADSLKARFDELRAQSAFIHEVLDNLPLGVVVLDDRLIVRRANRQFKTYAGRDDDAPLQGRGLYEAAAGLARLSEIVEDVRRTRRPFTSYGLPLELVAPQQSARSETTRGESRDEAGRAAGEREPEEKYWDVIIYPTSGGARAGRGDLLLILNEVSDRVRAEKLATTAFTAERARAAELSSVINQMDDGVVIVDRRGRYRVNPAAARILGRAPGEFRDGVAALIDDIALLDMTGRPLAPAETPFRQSLDGGRRIIAERFKIIRRTATGERGDVADNLNRGRDGNEGASGARKENRALSISATPLVSETAERAGAVAVFRDVTDEAMHHDALVAAYDRLREHDRLKTAFVANISHELRTPLNVIIGLCQIMARDRRTPLAGEQTESVARMERNALNLLTLVNNLLDYSRLEAGRSALHFEPINVGELAREVAESYMPEAEAKNVRLEVEVAPDVRRIYTDRQKLIQVMRNLVGNAVKFTATGEVRVRVAGHDAERWMLEVSDTGIGMTANEQAFVFDDFRQGDERLARRFGGVGLGLAITRKIIELLGGEMTVESALERGSRFRIVWEYAPMQRTGTGSLLAPDAFESRRSRA